MDIATIGAAATSLKAAGDIASTLIGLKKSTDVQAKAIELNQKLIEAQHQIFAVNAEYANLMEKVRSLEAELERQNDWNKIKENYKLTNPWDGPAQVYGVKESCVGEVPHWICTKCFEDKRRSILQPQENIGSRILMICATCKAEINTGYNGIGPAEYVPD